MTFARGTSSRGWRSEDEDKNQKQRRSRPSAEEAAATAGTDSAAPEERQGTREGARQETQSAPAGREAANESCSHRLPVRTNAPVCTRSTTGALSATRSRLRRAAAGARSAITSTSEPTALATTHLKCAHSTHVDKHHRMLSRSAPSFDAEAPGLREASEGGGAWGVPTSPAVLSPLPKHVVSDPQFNREFTTKPRAMQKIHVRTTLLDSPLLSVPLQQSCVSVPLSMRSETRHKNPRGDSVKNQSPESMPRYENLMKIRHFPRGSQAHHQLGQVA